MSKEKERSLETQGDDLQELIDAVSRDGGKTKGRKREPANIKKLLKKYEAPKDEI